MNLTTKPWLQWGIIIPLLALLETTSWGSTNAPAGKARTPEANRVLLILETSKGMQKHGQLALEAIDDLLGSGMHGQMQPGDTIGLWTYNDELYTGQLPVQAWTPKTTKDVRERTLNFITQQKLEKSGKLQKVLPRMARIVNDSEFITVVLVNNGDDKISGTPYDSQINEYYKTCREKQGKAVNPFVTILRGERGKLTGYSVGQARGTIEVPPIPPERVASQLAQNKPAAAPVKKTPPPMGKPLIVSGGSRRTEPVDGVKSAPSSIPIPQLIPQPIPQAIAQPVSQPTLGEVLKDPRLETAEEIVARLLAEAGQPREITPPLKVISTHGSTSKAAGYVISSPSTETIAAISSPPLASSAEGTMVHSNTAANITTQAVPAVIVSSTSAMPAKAVEPAAIVNQEPILTKSEPVKPSTIAPADIPNRISESPTATAAAHSESFLQRKPLQRAAMALAAGALVCLFIAMRRPKTGYQPSIITRSLERESR